MVIALPTKRYVAQRKQEREWAEEKLEAAALLLDTYGQMFDVNRFYDDFLKDD